MRLTAILIVLCLYFHHCNGIPPRNVPRAHRYRGVQITDEEDKFIIKELSRLFVDDQHIFSKPLWKTIADKHRRKWRQGTPGFPQERNSNTLCARMRLLAKYDHPQSSTKVPERLLTAIRQDLNKSARPRRVPYTPEEEKFIIEELSKPSPFSPFATSTVQDIHTKHKEKLQAGTPGFENARSIDSIRWHISKMKRDGILPDEVVKKVRIYGKGASSSAPTPPNLQTDEEMTDEEEDESS